MRTRTLLVALVHAWRSAVGVAAAGAAGTNGAQMNESIVLDSIVSLLGGLQAAPA